MSLKDETTRRDRQRSAKEYCEKHPARTMTIRVCNVPGCMREVSSYSFCNKHYQEWLQYGEIKKWPLPEDLPGEKWRDVVGFEGAYLVSSLGRVKRKSDETIRRGKAMTARVKILKADIDKKGYCRVHLSNGGSKKSLLIHRLVAAAFIPNPEDKPQVNHIDGNPSNNAVTNLEWCDQSYQEIHKHYVLGHQSHSYAPRKIKNTKTNKTYPSIGSASRDSGVPVYDIFSRLQNGKEDADGNIWEYVV